MRFCRTTHMSTCLYVQNNDQVTENPTVSSRKQNRDLGRADGSWLWLLLYLCPWTPAREITR